MNKYYFYEKNNFEIIFIYKGGNKMAKAGMKRPDPGEPYGTESNKKMHKNKNDAPPVPEIQGKAKAGHKKANDMPSNY